LFLHNFHAILVGVEISIWPRTMGVARIFPAGWNSEIRFGGMSEKQPQTLDGLVVQETKPKLQKPPFYKVILLNDDYTPMEFVVAILQRIFYKSREEATRIMLHVHQQGIGVCGVFTWEVAETKVRQVLDFAKENRHPLKCTLEPE
jgi:ATP-dependent Clp protease adaptor protein ClpS